MFDGCLLAAELADEAYRLKPAKTVRESLHAIVD
jgi:hypothetical protein